MNYSWEQYWKEAMLAEEAMDRRIAEYKKKVKK